MYETYRNVRFLKFCKPDGKGPDKLFAHSELRPKSKLTRESYRGNCRSWKINKQKDRELT